jgi:hypothetical protein
MHFALLLSQLPQVDNARAQYSDMFELGSQPYRIVGMVRAVWALLAKLAS